MSLADIRREYLGQPLSETESDPDPFRQFARWFEQVRDLETDPTAMALATATGDGRPSVRTVLLKGVDDRGFIFYTNYNSRKARDLAATGRASLLFLWRSLERQVRIDGVAEKVSAEESDSYFATRPIESREALESRFTIARQTYGERVPRPKWWGGYRVIPDEFEFWQGRPSRLHDRLRYAKQPDGYWRRDRLAP
jgi:pyridoxamine 5'-phosphate oxidase